VKIEGQRSHPEYRDLGTNFGRACFFLHLHTSLNCTILLISKIHQALKTFAARVCVFVDGLKEIDMLVLGFPRVEVSRFE
jgi:hypothetical protein